MFDENMNSNDAILFKEIIQDIAKNEIRHANVPTYIAAIVQKINDDGTVNVYLPPNVSNSVTGILNKCNEPLKVGDSVEIATKSGSLTNCWVALKHGTTYPTEGIKDIQDQIELLKKEIEKGVYEKAYPVGSVYINAVDNTNPAILFGIGDWIKIEDVFLLGAGNDYSLGDMGGERTHTLTVDEIPAHKHQIKTNNDDFNGTQAGGNYGTIKDGTTVWRNNDWYTENTGGGQAHNNMPPYLAANMWLRIN